MAVDFRGHPMFPPGFNSPTRFEADVYDCEVWGKIPTDIEGNFYRMQCDFEYRPPQNEWPTGFNGDGHVSRFRFENGSVDFAARYVKTARLMAEREARKRLFGVYRNHFTDDPSVAQHQPLGRQHPHLLARRQAADAEGRLAAVDGRSAHARDAGRLELQRQVQGHHHVGASEDRPGDRRDDRLRLPGQGRSHRRHRRVQSIRKARSIKEVWFKSPYVGIIHDIAITQKYILIPVIARTTSLERLKSGEPMWEWNGDLPTMVGVLPRDGDAKDVRWFKGPSRNTLHFLNATDRGSKIMMELPVSSGERDPSQIRRWTFDMKYRKKDPEFQEEVISTTPGCCRAWTIASCRSTIATRIVGNRDPSSRRIEAAPGHRAVQLERDAAAGRAHGRDKQCFVEPVQSLQESCFVPRKNAKDEGDGYLMGIASNYETMTSDLVIVDAQRMERAPSRR